MAVLAAHSGCESCRLAQYLQREVIASYVCNRAESADGSLRTLVLSIEDQVRSVLLSPPATPSCSLGTAERLALIQRFVDALFL